MSLIPAINDPAAETSSVLDVFQHVFIPTYAYNVSRGEMEVSINISNVNALYVSQLQYDGVGIGDAQGNFSIGTCNTGSFTLFSNTIELGFATGENLASGSNVFVAGNYALQSGQVAEDSVVIGTFAAQKAQILSNAVIIGNATANTASNVESSIIVGALAGSNIGTAYKSVVIGDSAYLTGNLCNSILLGADVQSFNLGQNVLVIGSNNLITGLLDCNAVAIGKQVVVPPSYQLDVSGSIYASNAVIDRSVTINGTGTGAGFALDVTGNTNICGNVVISGTLAVDASFINFDVCNGKLTLIGDLTNAETFIIQQGGQAIENGYLGVNISAANLTFGGPRLTVSGNSEFWGPVTISGGNSLSILNNSGNRFVTEYGYGGGGGNSVRMNASGATRTMALQMFPDATAETFKIIGNGTTEIAVFRPDYIELNTTLTKISNTLNVSGLAYLQSNVQIASNLNVSGSTFLQSNVQIASNLNVSGSTFLQSNVQIASNLNVSGLSYLQSNVQIACNLIVNGSSGFHRDIEVTNTNDNPVILLPNSVVYSYLQTVNAGVGSNYFLINVAGTNSLVQTTYNVNNNPLGGDSSFKVFLDAISTPAINAVNGPGGPKVYNYSNSGTWDMLSDSNVKENITDADYSRCYDIVKQTGLRRYTYKKGYGLPDSDTYRLGFIAQEVQQVFPKNVTADSSGFLSLNTEQLNFALYGAVHKLMEKVEQLETTISSLLLK